MKRRDLLKHASALLTGLFKAKDSKAKGSGRVDDHSPTEESLYTARWVSGKVYPL